MPGLYGIHSKKTTIPLNNYQKFYSYKFQNMINEENNYNQFTYGRSSLNKFQDDKCLFENESLIIGFEGYHFNKSCPNNHESIIKSYEKEGIDFIKSLDGLFSGFIYDKNKNKIFIFDDYLSYKPVYYYHNKEQELFIFSFEMKMITSLLRDLKINFSIDNDSIYSLLSVGYCFYDYTVVQEVKKLTPGTILEIDLDSFNFKEERYYRLSKKKNNNLSKNDIIERIDELLIKATKKQWDKDLEYNYNHYGLLSGGLDSRVGLMIAKELGYNKITSFTFSQSNTLDDIISSQISSENNFQRIFYSLSGGDYLVNNIYDYINANDGLVYYSGSAHMYRAVEALNNNNYGMLHKGQIGDALFGSLIPKKFNTIFNKYVDLNFLNKISFINNIHEEYNNYENYELFVYEQKIMNAIMINQNMLSVFTDLCSPFFDRDLLEFCLTIPDHYKLNEAIYFDWFNKKHPVIAKYKWEKINAKPQSTKLMPIYKKINLYKNGIKKRLGLYYNNMNPFNHWINNNLYLKDGINKIFNDHINLVTDKELHNDIKFVFNNDNINYTNKFYALTAILAINLHFNQ